MISKNHTPEYSSSVVSVVGVATKKLPPASAKSVPSAAGCAVVSCATPSTTSPAKGLGSAGPGSGSTAGSIVITTAVASETSSASEPVKNVREPSASTLKRPVDTGAPSMMTHPSYTKPSPRGSRPANSRPTFVLGGGGGRISVAVPDGTPGPAPSSTEPWNSRSAGTGAANGRIANGAGLSSSAGSMVRTTVPLPRRSSGNSSPSGAFTMKSSPGNGGAGNGPEKPPKSSGPAASRNRPVDTG